jgi:hypothetical protein
MSSAPDPEFVEAIAAWALKDAARRSLVEAVERALADYGSPKIGTDEYVSVRHAAVVKSTTARLDVSWPAKQPTAGLDNEVREWLTYMDETIDNEEDTRIIAAINAFLDERARLVARVAELEAHPWQLVQAEQDEQDANVRDVADAVSILEGMLNEGCNYCTADVSRVRGLLLDAFARPIGALDAREAAAGGARPNGDPIWEEQ